MYDISIMGFSFYEILYFFLIYSFIGWLVEVAYAYTNRGHFVNRGFLYGPFCPLYGSSIVLMVILLDNFKNNLILLFILATLLTSAVEYVTGYLLEKIFKSKWWDYTDDPLNLNGYICLHFSLAWGAASVVVLKVIHPIVTILVSYIPENIGVPLFYIAFIYLICDLFFTLVSLMEFKKILLQLSQISSELKNRYNYIYELTREKAKDVKSPIKDLLGNYERWISRIDVNHKRLLKAFPTIKSQYFDNILKDAKNKFSLSKNNDEKINCDNENIEHIEHVK
ncbi:putative ABC transporter permease [Clostridium fallax]|uniref:Uncharacterized membrane protein n=1 Tax=Clostridium fallax TaxID=1533 RepID=A0A1M4YZA7_9CLOT|nr:putative ABC transporter permease [Clostridium fallax]SHF10842.1 Uncharacterized membrane protein [Clostridium fallax]SQB07385.1 membrane protein [Clostridium fallax]